MIKLPQVVHCKKDKYTLLIDRSTKWGNPFSYKENTTAQFKALSHDDSILQHEAWLLQQPRLMQDLPELIGQTLGCWCRPKRCHGDNLRKFVAQYLTDEAELTLLNASSSLNHLQNCLQTPAPPDLLVVMAMTDRGSFYLPHYLNNQNAGLFLKKINAGFQERGCLNLFFWEEITL